MTSSARRRLARLLFGEAGFTPALVLAGVALIVTFISMAGARALVSADNTATRQALRQEPAIDNGLLVSADLQAWPKTGVLPAARIAALTRVLAAQLPRPADFLPGQDWGGVLGPLLDVTNPAPSAVVDLPPLIEAAYRTGLADHAKVLAGVLPDRPGRVSSSRPGSATLTVAVTRAVATRFSLTVGSVIDLSPATAADLAMHLKVTAIIAPTDQESSFWQVEPALMAPALSSFNGPNTSYWLAGVFLGPGDVGVLPVALQGKNEQASWFFPLRTNLTAAQVPRLESALAGFATSPKPRDDELAVHESALTTTAVSAGLAQGLGSFISQWHIVATADSLLLVGLFAAGLLLLFVGSELAAQAYRTELVITRVRGGSLRQLAGAMLARSALITGPALLLGGVSAVLLWPAGGSRASWLLGGLTAVAALGSLPALAVLAQRERKLADVGRVDEVIAARPRLRRLVGELAIVAVAAAAVADLRFRGTATANTSSYLSASAVLVAAVVGLLVNRLYRGPLRGLAKVASGLKGAVGVVGLTRAALARTGSIGPALTLMLTMTLVAFSAMVLAAVSAGQVAASWAQTGADVQISVPGTNTHDRISGVTASQLHALAQVPGVTGATAVYTAASTGTQAVNVSAAGQQSPPLGVAVVTPASYATVSADGPWAAVPAAALARGSTHAGDAVPVLATADVVAFTQAHPGAIKLEFAGLSTPVKIVGTIAASAAMSSGGSYVLLPRWAAARLPGIPPPLTVLLKGSDINLPKLRSAVTAQFALGSAISTRQAALAQLDHSPALHLSRWLYLSSAIAAAVLSVFAVLFALASTARSRSGMMTELAALGIARSQALRLSLTDAVPLLAVAAVGSAISGWVLAVVLGPVLGLAVFTDDTVPVTLEPTWLALLAPIVAVAVLAVAFLWVESQAAGRRNLGSILRIQEAGPT